MEKEISECVLLIFYIIISSFISVSISYFVGIILIQVIYIYMFHIPVPICCVTVSILSYFIMVI